jgi:uncharacterized protein YecE (DUF72 family)
MVLWVGTSGWQYRDWRGPFYPEKLPQRRWLEHYAASFACVEVNNTFYRLPTEEAFAAWAETAPAGFRFALKISRYLTHVRRLRDPGDPVRTFLERSQALRAHLGPLLLQLPPNLAVDAERLEETLSAFPSRLRVAVEVRHPSWFREEVAEVLRRHAAALCLTDREGEPQEPEWATAPWGYLRFHKGTSQGWRYQEATLREWTERVDRLWGPGGDVYAFFNNDPGGAAIADAIALARTGLEAGLSVSRVPIRDRDPRAR